MSVNRCEIKGKSQLEMEICENTWRNLGKKYGVTENGLDNMACCNTLDAELVAAPHF